MASFPSYNAQTKKYNLGKGLIPAQECFDAVSTFNPTYELVYWSWALQKAQEWKERLGLPRDKKWMRLSITWHRCHSEMVFIWLQKVHPIVTNRTQNI